jgi:hypothetical protein
MLDGQQFLQPQRAPHRKHSSSFIYEEQWRRGADPSGCTVYGVGLRQLACWDFGFESLRGHGCLSIVSAACCQVDVSATGRSVFRRVLPSVVCLTRKLWTNVKQERSCFTLVHNFLRFHFPATLGDLASRGRSLHSLRRGHPLPSSMPVHPHCLSPTDSAVPAHTSSYTKLVFFLPAFSSSWTSWPLKLGPISCPEMSVKDYHSTLRDIQEECQYQAFGKFWQQEYPDSVVVFCFFMYRAL